MNQKVVEGLAKILEDEKLKKEFSDAKTNQEKYDIAKPYIGDVSFEEFDNFADKVVAAKKTLTTDDLENVSGGITKQDWEDFKWGFKEGISLGSTLVKGIFSIF